MIAEHQLRTFRRILSEYPAGASLHKFLSVYYKQNRQMGSRDRKTASQFLYAYFRLGKALPSADEDTRLFIALFLTGTLLPVLAHFRPDMAEKVDLSFPEKTAFLKSGFPEFHTEDIFPFHAHLSEGIDKEVFITSFLTQPDLFIRIRKGSAEQILAQLDKAGVQYELCNKQKTCIRLPNQTNLKELFTGQEQKSVEVQDLSSQQTAEFFKPVKGDYWWDCCAGSGGKSLALFEQESDIRLLASDIRDSVLQNLDERFAQAGITRYERRKFDLLQPITVLSHQTFDGIILDAPCTGSGTWARTPELLSAFEESQILFFQKLQKAIVANVISFLKPGKPLVYITCSVFREENEEVKDFLIGTQGMELESEQLIRGYEHKADTMYVARLVKKGDER